MDGQAARAAIIRWARDYFADEETSKRPQVEVLSMKSIGDVALGDQEWVAELWVATSDDNPIVIFFIDEQGIQASSVEY